MSTFFAQIDELSQVSKRHEQYAESLLTLFISNILDLDEIDVGVSNDSKETKSIITFTSDEFEKVIIHLTYCPSQNFRIIVLENSDDFEDSKFYYTIHQDSLLERMIPDRLREVMENVAFDEEPEVIMTKKLQS